MSWSQAAYPTKPIRYIASHWQRCCARRTCATSYVEAIEPTVMTPEKFGDFIRADIARWTKLAQDRGIQLDS